MWCGSWKFVPRSSPYPLRYRLDVLTSPGTLVLAASGVAFLVMVGFGMPASAFGITFAATLRQLVDAHLPSGP